MGTVIVTPVCVSRNRTVVETNHISSDAYRTHMRTADNVVELNTITFPSNNFRETVPIIAGRGGFYHTLAGVDTFIPVSRILLMFDWDFDTKTNEELTAYINSLNLV